MKLNEHVNDLNNLFENKIKGLSVRGPMPYIGAYAYSCNGGVGYFYKITDVNSDKSVITLEGLWHNKHQRKKHPYYAIFNTDKRTRDYRCFVLAKYNMRNKLKRVDTSMYSNPHHSGSLLFVSNIFNDDECEKLISNREFYEKFVDSIVDGEEDED